MQQPIAPWIIAFSMASLVFGLSFYDKHRPTHPSPEMDFYSQAVVKVRIPHGNQAHEVYGLFNNIIEGERLLVKSRAGNGDTLLLQFEVNSPRPATIYIDDDALEVFLVPDSTLTLNVVQDTVLNDIDTVYFSGYAAPVCRYYRDREVKFSVNHLRSNRGTISISDSKQGDYARQLDSVAFQELGFLISKSIQYHLPPWFVAYEQNAILYQKAYLKLIHLPQDSVAHSAGQHPQYLDDMPLNNDSAKYSYHYYLYLRTHIEQLTGSTISANNSDSYENIAKKNLSIADTLLKNEVRDVYISRIIFDAIKSERVAFAQMLLDKYGNSFSSRRYARFLATQIENQRKPA